MFGIFILSILSILFLFIGNVISYGGFFAASSTWTIICLWGLFYFAYIGINCFGLCYGFKEYGREHKLSRYLMLLLTAIIYNVVMTYCFHLYMPTQVTLHSVMDAFLLLSNNVNWFFTAFTGMFLLSPIIDYLVAHISRETAIKAAWVVGLLGLYGLMTAGELKDPFLLKGGHGIVWFTCLYFIGAIVREHQLYQVNLNKTALLGIGTFILNGILMLSLDKFVGNAYDDYFLSSLTPLLAITSLCLFYLFANMKSSQEAIAKWIDESTICTYLLASQPLLLSHVLMNQFISFAGMPFYFVVMLILMTSLSLYVLALMIDCIRRGLFKLMRIEKFTLWIEKGCQNIINRLTLTINKNHDI